MLQVQLLTSSRSLPITLQEGSDLYAALQSCFHALRLYYGKAVTLHPESVGTITQIITDLLWAS